MGQDQPLVVLERDRLPGGQQVPGDGRRPVLEAQRPGAGEGLQLALGRDENEFVGQVGAAPAGQPGREGALAGSALARQEEHPAVPDHGPGVQGQTAILSSEQPEDDGVEQLRRHGDIQRTAVEQGVAVAEPVAVPLGAEQPERAGGFRLGRSRQIGEQQVEESTGRLVVPGDGDAAAGERQQAFVHQGVVGAGCRGHALRPVQRFPVPPGQ